MNEAERCEKVCQKARAVRIGAGRRAAMAGSGLPWLVAHSSQIGREDPSKKNWVFWPRGQFPSVFCI